MPETKDFVLSLNPGDIVNDTTTLFNVIVVSVESTFDVKVYNPYTGKQKIVKCENITKAASNKEIVEWYLEKAHLKEYFSNEPDPIYEAIKNGKEVCDENGLCLITSLTLLPG